MNRTSSITIIQNPNIANLSPIAIQYLRKHSRHSFQIFFNQNISETIVDQYLLGIRKFILSITSGEILGIQNLIQRLTDVEFVAPASTLQSLRGKYPNLYFTSASNTYIDLIISDFSSALTLSCLVYDDLTDPFILEVVERFQQAGFATFEVNDLGWTDYANIMINSVDPHIWNQINSNLNTTREYNLYGLEIFPPNDLLFQYNVIGVNILSPNPTVMSQTNSYWNYISRNSLFSMGTSMTNMYPILVNQSWNQLEKYNLMSTLFELNNYYYIRYVSLYDIEIRYNLHNSNLVPDPCYIWLVSPEYVEEYSQFNRQYLKQINPRIRKIRVTDDFESSVCKYWRRGYRQFILDAPSETIIKIQQMHLRDSFFLCLRSTDPEIRLPGSNFVFTLADDITMINDKFNAGNKATLDGLVAVLGTSNNINIEDFRIRLDQLDIPWVNIDQLNQIPPSVFFIDTVGNDNDYQQVFDLVISEPDRFPNLTSLGKYGLYINELQHSTLVQAGLGGLFSLINFNSSQPFLESDYSIGSRPLYLPNYIVFLYLSNILLQFSPCFLYNFGYIIDI